MKKHLDTFQTGNRIGKRREGKISYFCRRRRNLLYREFRIFSFRFGIERLTFAECSLEEEPRRSWVKVLINAILPFQQFLSLCLKGVGNRVKPFIFEFRRNQHFPPFRKEGEGGISTFLKRRKAF